MKNSITKKISISILIVMIVQILMSMVGIMDFAIKSHAYYDGKAERDGLKFEWFFSYPYGAPSKTKAVTTVTGIAGSLPSNGTLNISKLGDGYVDDYIYKRPIVVKSIGEKAFCNMAKLEKVYIPNTLTNIGESAFYKTGLKELNIGNNGLSIRIGSNAFNSCYKLETVKIESQLDDIEYGVFNECIALKSISFSKGVRAIHNYAFSDCKSLTSIDCKGDVKSIGDEAFAGCTSLREVKIAGEKASTGYVEFDGIGNKAFFNCNKLTNITIPKSVKSIGEQAFAHCTSLKTIKIPGNVKTIGESAFFECTNLKEVIIEEGVEEIQENAFLICNNLKYVYIPKSVKSIHKYLSSNFKNSNATIICYKGSVAEEYAKKYNLNYVNIDENPGLYLKQKGNTLEYSVGRKILGQSIYLLDTEGKNIINSSKYSGSVNITKSGTYKLVVKNATTLKNMFTKTCTVKLNRTSRK